LVSYIRLSATRNNSAAEVTGGNPGTVAAPKLDDMGISRSAVVKRND
jgi:hypothetical protein